MNAVTLPYQGESLALLTAVIWAVAVILFKRSGESVHPIGLNLFKGVLAAVLFLPTLWIFEGYVMLSASWQDYGLLMVSGALGIGIADTLFFMCLNRLGAGLTAIVDCLYAPSIIGLSMLWLGEILSWLQILGVVLIISAVFTATYRPPTGAIVRRDLILGITYGTLAMALMALGIVMIKPLLNRSPLLWVTETRLVGGVIVLLAVLALHRSRRAIVSSIYSAGGMKYTLSGSFIGGYLSMVIWLAGMKFTQVSTAAALNQTSNIFIFVFAALFLRERITLPSAIGIVVAVGGALLVTFTGGAP